MYIFYLLFISLTDVADGTKVNNCECNNDFHQSGGGEGGGSSWLTGQGTGGSKPSLATSI